MSEAEAIIRRLYDAALRAAEPAGAVERAVALAGRELIVGERRVPVRGRLVLVAVGKAAVSMTRGALTVCGELLDRGVVITKDGHVTEALPPPLAVYEAAHPIPDERSVRATREALALLSGLTADDVVLALISGGGSALLEAPRPPVTLADMARTTDLLLRAGAPIQDLNAVRIPLSLVKGGGLRAAAGEATVVTLILSDVLGNDPRVIASGPTVPGGATRSVALATLDRYGLRHRVPPAVVEALHDRGAVNPAAGHDPRDVLVVVADNGTAVQAALAEGERLGLGGRVVWKDRSGEAADLARTWVDLCADEAEADLLLGGGEATVTVRGDGVGGRNTEFALAAALALEERRLTEWTVASLATDGQDGPTDAAGAIADAGTPARCRAGGVAPEALLAANDSLRAFQIAGGLVVPGPTGTNVNDLYFALRARW